MKWLVIFLCIGAVVLTFGIVFMLYIERFEDTGVLGGIIWLGVLTMAIGLIPHYYRAGNSYVESVEPVTRRHFRRTVGYLQHEIFV